MQRQQTNFIDGGRALEAPSLVAAAHELKEPLALIRLYAQMLSDTALEDSERRRFERRIGLAAEQLLELTSGLVEGYRWQQQVLPLEPVNTHVVCEEVAHEVFEYARAHGQQLAYRPASSRYVVVAHRSFLKNVLNNLLCNAVKHTPAGSDIVLQPVKRQGALQIQVCDTGPGFSKNTMKALQRAENLRQPLPGRSGGLGLLVAQELVRAMYGELRVVASRSGGTVSVTLPLSQQISLLA